MVEVSYLLRGSAPPYPTHPGHPLLRPHTPSLITSYNPQPSPVCTNYSPQLVGFVLLTRVPWEEQGMIRIIMSEGLTAEGCLGGVVRGRGETLGWVGALTLGVLGVGGNCDSPWFCLLQTLLFMETQGQPLEISIE